MNLLKMKPKNCVKCGRKVMIKGGPEEWIPTYSYPDSGGRPYYINCECGLSYSNGYCEYFDFIKEWNNSDNDFKSFEIESEQDYDGFVFVCESKIKEMMDFYRYYDEYKNFSDYDCEYEDDGHCLYNNENKICKNAIKIGYVKYLNHFHYPKIGDKITIYDDCKIIITD